jgi:hypothetical protein
MSLLFGAAKLEIFLDITKQFGKKDEFILKPFPKPWMFGHRNDINIQSLKSGFDK